MAAMANVSPSVTSTVLLAVARLAATRAGEHAAANLHRRGDAALVARHDVKHKLDVECQEVATATILSAFADHAVLGEESVEQYVAPAGGVEWVLDPIDGTINFFHGLPLWCCSVAARVDGRVVAGVVYAPELRLCFEATWDGPAICNGEVLQVSATDDLTRATVHTGSDKSESPARAFRFFTALGLAVQRPRILGSAALDLCFVAAGRADGYFEHGIYLWDMAAAGLIIERAGGTCEVLKAHGGYRLAVLATNGRLHAPLKALLAPLLSPS